MLMISFHPIYYRVMYRVRYMLDISQLLDDTRTQIILYLCDVCMGQASGNHGCTRETKTEEKYCR
jgi:hypothetical protein